MLLINNHHVIVPKTQELSFFMANIVTGAGTERGAHEQTGTLSNSTEFLLDFQPISPDWLEVYIDNVRVVNPSYPTRMTAAAPGEAYQLRNGRIVFSQPQTGNIRVISDTIVNPLPENTSNVSLRGLVIRFDNIQNYDTYRQRFLPSRYAAGRPGTNVAPLDWYNTELRARVGDALYAEPLVLRQPEWGYVRLTQDRRNLLYVPPVNFYGYDVFTYTMITQHGQIGQPRCCRIEVFGPPPPRSLTLSANLSNVQEGNVVTITLTSVGYPTGAEFDYAITGTNITVNDFYNRDVIAGTYALAARTTGDAQTVSTVSNGQAVNYELSSVNPVETLYYTVESTAAAAVLNINSLQGKFRITVPPGGGQTGSASFTAYLYPDYIDEGTEVFRVSLTSRPTVNVSVNVTDLSAFYAISSNLVTVFDDSVVSFAVDSKFTNEPLYYTIENADGSPIPYIPPGYTITAVKL